MDVADGEDDEGKAAIAALELHPKKAPKKAVNAVLAQYAGEPLCRGGIRFSSAAQSCISVLLSCAYGEGYRYCTHSKVSDNDLAAFRGAGSYGAEVYGELLPEGFIDLLWQIGARPGDRFYDLGSGTGKLAVLAWLAGLRSSGIELSEDRWSTSRDSLGRLAAAIAEGRAPLGGGKCASGLPARQARGLECLWGDMLEVDFTDADFVFISSLMFSGGMVAKIARIARWMKPGAKIIAFQDFSDLGGSADFSEFKLLGEFCEPTSWKLAAWFQVTTITGTPPESDNRPSGLKSIEEFDTDRRCACVC